MLEFVIGISFIIHVVTLTALYMLYQHMKQRSTSQVDDINRMMQAYVAQIKKENEELRDVLESNTRDETVSNEKQASIASTSYYNKQNEPVTDPTAVTDVEETVSETVVDSVETSLESRVLQLHRSGIPVNEIAKQLKCGKTEAALIIQFQEKK